MACTSSTNCNTCGGSISFNLPALYGASGGMWANPGGSCGDGGCGTDPPLAQPVNMKPPRKINPRPDIFPGQFGGPPAKTSCDCGCAGGGGDS